jgi:hypothetical protein
MKKRSQVLSLQVSVGQTLVMADMQKNLIINLGWNLTTV